MSERLGQTAYIEFIKYLAQKATPEAVLAFETSDEVSERIQDLLDHNSEGLLTAEEKAELEQFLEFDDLVTSLKMNALKTLRTQKQL